MDIQVGDRVTLKALQENDSEYLGTNKEQYRIITSKTVLEKLKKHDEIERIKILKIERPTWEVVEEKKELLTEEEREFLKLYKNAFLSNETDLKIKKDGICNIVITTEQLFINIFVNEAFSGLEDGVYYTFEELGLEE